MLKALLTSKVLQQTDLEFRSPMSYYKTTLLNYNKRVWIIGCNYPTPTQD